jgi:hypothetical protein
VVAGFESEGDVVVDHFVGVVVKAAVPGDGVLVMGKFAVQSLRGGGDAAHLFVSLVADFEHQFLHCYKATFLAKRTSSIFTTVTITDPPFFSRKFLIPLYI